MNPTVDQAANGRRRLWLAGGLVAVAVGLLLVQGLGEATLYFRTADEAVAQKEELGDRRFRLEGDVVDGSVAAEPGLVSFMVTSKGVSVRVRHEGDPPELFQPGIPVVLEGAFDGDTFASDRMLVKHSETYIAEYPDRVAPAGAAGSADAEGEPAARTAGATPGRPLAPQPLFDQPSP
ncbi:MAG: cytochrome c maturation protein CcmE [Acidimicrobiales bacterium]